MDFLDSFKKSCRDSKYTFGRWIDKLVILITGEEIPKEEKEEVLKKILEWNKNHPNETKKFIKELDEKTETKIPDNTILHLAILFISIFSFSFLLIKGIDISSETKLKILLYCISFLLSFSLPFIIYINGKNIDKLYMLIISPVVYIIILKINEYLFDFKLLYDSSPNDTHVARSILIVAVVGIFFLILFKHIIERKAIINMKENYLHFTIGERGKTTEEMIDMLVNNIHHNIKESMMLFTLCSTEGGRVYDLGRYIRLFFVYTENKFSFQVIKQAGRYMKKDRLSETIQNKIKYLFRVIMHFEQIDNSMAQEMYVLQDNLERKYLIPSQRMKNFLDESIFKSMYDNYRFWIYLLASIGYFSLVIVIIYNISPLFEAIVLAMIPPLIVFVISIIVKKLKGI